MRPLLPPILLLLLLAGFGLWNARTIEEYTDRCIAGVDDAIRYASAENWPAVREALSASHAQWQSCRSYLRITATHSMVDAADSMYCRALAFAETEEPTEFRAEAAELRVQLRHMAETEGVLLENIL